MKYFIFPLILFVSHKSLSQENNDIITDRPDQTEATELIPKGFFQIETGFVFEELQHEENNRKIWTYNTSLLRYGMLDNLELRLGWDIIDKEENLAGFQTNPETGFAPLLLGAKIGIAGENGIFPKMAFLGHLYLPFTVKEDYRPESTGVDFRFAFSHEFNTSTLSYNLGAKWGDDATHATFIYTLAYGHEIVKNFMAFIELYGDLPENDGAAHFWDSGLTYLVGSNFQLDAFIGTGINNEQRIIYGGGISFRLPN